jgi:hypothetical protein
VPLSIGIAWAQGSGFWHTLLAIVLSITALQLGFLVGGIVLQGSQQPRQRNGDIPKAEGEAQPQHDQLAVAREELDGMLPDLIALSKHLTEKPAASANAREADPPEAAASGSAR